MFLANVTGAGRPFAVAMLTSALMMLEKRDWAAVGNASRMVDGILSPLARTSIKDDMASSKEVRAGGSSARDEARSRRAGLVGIVWRNDAREDP